MRKYRIGNTIVLLVIGCFICNMNIQAYAADVTSTVQPYYVGVSDTLCILTLSSGKTTCTGKVILRSGYHASLTLSLQRSSNGTSWSTIKTWTASGSSVEKSYYVLNGYEYRAKLSANVYNSSGTLVDTISTVSKIQSY